MPKVANVSPGEVVRYVTDNQVMVKDPSTGGVFRLTPEMLRQDPESYFKAARDALIASQEKPAPGAGRKKREGSIAHALLLVGGQIVSARAVKNTSINRDGAEASLHVQAFQEGIEDYDVLILAQKMSGGVPAGVEVPGIRSTADFLGAMGFDLSDDVLAALGAEVDDSGEDSEEDSEDLDLG